MMRLFVMMGMIAMLLFSCREEEPPSREENGKLVVNLEIYLKIEKKLPGKKSLEDFRLSVYDGNNNLVLEYPSIAEMPDTLELFPGNYYITAHSDNNFPAAFENPYYFGQSEVFSLNSGELEEITIECRLANTMVSVHYSDNIENRFDDYFTTIKNSTDSLVFTRDETRAGFFFTEALSIRVDLGFTNPDQSIVNKTLTGEIPDPEPGFHYEVHVDASLESGLAALLFTLDTADIPVEVIELVEQTNPPPSDLIAFGELIITEIMPNPEALSDADGEWFEIYNTSDHEISLQGIVLERDNTNMHSVSENISIGPGEWYVFQRNSGSTGAVAAYNYGTSILLPNTGAELSMYNPDSGTGRGDLIFTINYGLAGFNFSPGMSLSLNPDLHNAADAILPASWCMPVSIYSTGDSGTPGSMNDPCQ